MKQAILRTMRAGAKGVPASTVAVASAGPRWRVVSGTAKAACRCTTLRADIDFGRATAKTNIRRHRRQMLDLQGPDLAKARLPITDGAPIGDAIAPQPEAPVELAPQPVAPPSVVELASAAQNWVQLKSHRRSPPPKRPRATRAKTATSAATTGNEARRQDQSRCAEAEKPAASRKEGPSQEKPREEDQIDADPEESQVPQDAPRPAHGHRHAWRHGRVWRLRPAGGRGVLMSNRQIEAARRAMTRHVKRGGQIWIRVFPDKSITKKPAETRMGSARATPKAGSPWSCPAASSSRWAASRPRSPRKP